MGKKKIDYPIPAMEKYLDDTYGITVYQEQVDVTLTGAGRIYKR